MSHLPPNLAALAERFGIQTEFTDWKGRHVLTPADSVVHVLAALGVDASTPEMCDAELERLERTAWERVLPPCTVAEEGEHVHVNVHVPSGTPLGLEVVLENGHRWWATQVANDLPDREVAGQWRGEATFHLGDQLPPGYHQVVATTAEGVCEAPLIITPRFVGFPTRMQGNRVWGYAAQLYSVASQGSWGLGDLTDLADLSTWAGSQAAGFVLVNPLHAAEPVPPMEPSPYLPASRRFLNPIYIRPESVPEYARLSDVQKAALERLRRDVARGGDETVALDRNAVHLAKLEALATIFTAPRRAARQWEFDAFREREGDGLRQFATWCVLCEEFGTNWRSWPDEYQDHSSDAVARFAERFAQRVEFHEWLQWVVQQQVSAAHLAAREAGMTVGVLTDLAVGVSGHGAETWIWPDLFAPGVFVGAPPDQYNQAGQNWGQPPWRPDRLEELAYEPFRAMVRQAMSRSGGVRIDHVLGMFRLWWVPQGLGPTQGCYVRNNHRALVGIIALEAQRSQALVVGEDLGTVEPWVRDYLRERGILGTSVLWFENAEDGWPLPPETWREYCMASVTTHDLPPTLAYLAGDHVRLREQLGLLEDSAETELERATEERARWVQILLDRGLLEWERREDEAEVMLALHRFLLTTPAKVCVAALTDAVGDRRAQNVPGTSNEYPNWRVPLSDVSGQPVMLEDLADARLPRRLAAVMNGQPDADRDDFPNFC